MLEIIIIILLIVLLTGRVPSWQPNNPAGLLVTILFVVLIIWLVLALIGPLPRLSIR